MDLNALLLALLAPLDSGAEVLPGVVLEDVSTELGFRLRLDASGERWWVDLGPVAHARRWAARSERLALGYRTEGGRAGGDSELGLRICEALVEVIRANEASVLAQIRQAAGNESDPTLRVRDVQATRALDPAGLGDARYYALNPYVGCVIGCRFCYAQSPLASMRSLLGLPDHQWGGYVDVRTNLPDLLRDELQRYEPAAIKFCPIVGDSYQPAEKVAGVTRGCLEAIAESGRPWSPLILTRSTLILRDLDVLARISGAWAGVSIPTADDEVRQHFEPRAASVAERLNVLSELKLAGVSTAAVIQPMMAGSSEALADALVGLADGVVLDVLYEEEGAVADFDAPPFAETRTEAWQRARAQQMRDLLREREIPVWQLELPPQLCGATPSSAGKRSTRSLAERDEIH